MVSRSSQRQTAVGAIVFGILALLCAGVGGVLFARVLKTRYSAEPVQGVVVAAKDLRAGHPLKREALRLVNWTRSSVPRGAFSSIELALKAEGVPLIPLVQGEAVLQSHLAAPNKAGMGIAALVEPGKRAISLSTADPVALSRLLYPGARVDVLQSRTEDLVRNSPHEVGLRRKAAVTRFVLQNVKVLAVGEDIDPVSVARRTSGAESNGGSGVGPDGKEVRAVVTLLVSPREAALITLARRTGKLAIALRGSDDVGGTAGADKDSLVVTEDELAPVPGYIGAGRAAAQQAMVAATMTSSALTPRPNALRPRRRRRRRRRSASKKRDSARVVIHRAGGQ